MAASKRSARSPQAAAKARAEQHRQIFRRRLLVSALLHGAVVGGLAAAPAADPHSLPAVVQVSLVSAPPQPPAARAAPKPAPPRPAPPKPPAPAPKPKAIPKKVVLPEKPAPIPEKPKKVEPKRPPEPEPEPQKEPLDYEDALAALREELGEEEPTAARESPAEQESSGLGQRVPEEVARWMQQTKVAVQRSWITPPEFLNRSLATLVRVRLDAGGQVVGTPEVIRSSGDPFWDDNTVRAIERASPLPPPPEPGAWEFRFSPQENP